MNLQIFLITGAAILCVDCPIEVEMSLVSPKNIARKCRVVSHSVEKTNYKCMQAIVVCPYQAALGYGESCMESSALCF